ncbi:MAG: DUF6036 family nucleotidyltransferase [Candidatus Woesearchaeota archaeon]
MISDFNQIEVLLEEIDRSLKKEVHLFMIGGGVLLYHGMKPATKDIDLIVEDRREFKELERALKDIGFESRIPTIEYRHMKLNQILVRRDFRIDLFHKAVCKGFSLSEGMAKRSEHTHSLSNLKLSLCSNEDIFLLKTMTEREGDLEDCISLAKRGLDWKAMLRELNHQIQATGNKVWITWVGERLDILEGRGLTIPIMPEVNKLREEYFKCLGKA